MYTETQKLHLIEEVLKTDDIAILSELEQVFRHSELKGTGKRRSAYEFAGVWSAEDAAIIEKAIEEGCENIDYDSWK